MTVKLWRKIAFILLILLQILSSGLALAANNQLHWAAPYLDEARGYGWISGGPEAGLNPNEYVSRGQFAFILWQALGSPAPQGECPFSDVAADAFYRDAVTSLFELGVVSGYGGGLFGPDDVLNREMSFVMLARAFNLAPAGNGQVAKYSTFSDYAEISAWAVDTTSLFILHGYVEGSGNRLMPKKPLPLGELAKLMVLVHNDVAAQRAQTGAAAPELPQEQTPPVFSSGDNRSGTKPAPNPAPPPSPPNPPPVIGYSITYQANGGAGSDYVLTGVSGSHTLPDNNTALFTPPEHHSFVGWNTDAQGRGSFYLPGESFNVSASTTFYAMWSGDGISASRPVLLYNQLMLESIRHNPDKHYKLVADIRLDSHNNWTPLGNAGNLPSSAFSGSFNGNGHIISGLTINGDGEYYGLFGYIGGSGVVKNLLLADVEINGEGTYLGGVAGKSEGLLQNCHVAGSVQGNRNVGGVVGQNNGTVLNCSAAGSVSGTYILTYTGAGGVAGCNYGLLQNCYSTGSVSGVGDVANGGVGGLVGCDNEGTVQNCYSESSVSSVRGLGNGAVPAGGVAGYNNRGQLKYCYATGSINGAKYVGGIVGRNQGDGIVENGVIVESGGIVKNCAALNPAVIISGLFNAGRVAGMSSDNALSGNYAREDMIIQDTNGNINIAGTEDDDEHGKNCEAQPGEGWWRGVWAAVWGNSAPDDDFPWQWDGLAGYPILYWQNAK